MRTNKEFRVHRIENPVEKRLFSMVRFRGTVHIHVGDLSAAIAKFAPPREDIRRFFDVKGQRYVSVRIVEKWALEWEPEQRRRLQRIVAWAEEQMERVEE